MVKSHGNTLLEGVCIRLTWRLQNHDMTYVMNMKEVQLSLSVIDIFNANMTCLYYDKFAIYN